jgi:hypothetical protein
METIRIYKNLYGRNIEFTIQNPDTGAVVDISGASKKKIYVGRTGKTSKLVNGDNLSFKTDGTDGILIWSPASGSLATAGYYDANIVLTYASGKEIIKSFDVHILDTI